MLCYFLLHSKADELYVDTYPLFFGLPAHAGLHRALSRVPCAVQQVLLSYRFYESGSVRLSAVPYSLQPYGLQPARLYVHGILQARIVEWVAVPFSSRDSQPRD